MDIIREIEKEKAAIAMSEKRLATYELMLHGDATSSVHTPEGFKELLVRLKTANGGGKLDDIQFLKLYESDCKTDRVYSLSFLYKGSCLVLCLKYNVIHVYRCSPEEVNEIHTNAPFQKDKTLIYINSNGDVKTFRDGDYIDALRGKIEEVILRLIGKNYERRIREINGYVENFSPIEF